jgi:hypothetical protein
MRADAIWVPGGSSNVLRRLGAPSATTQLLRKDRKAIRFQVTTFAEYPRFEASRVLQNPQATACWPKIALIF